MANVIMQRYITSSKDMDDMEAAIILELKGENHRCAFLRSQSYSRLRISALYKDTKMPCTAYIAGLKISLDWTVSGKRVTLQRMDCLEFHEAQDEHECDEPQRQQALSKRPRL